MVSEVELSETVHHPGDLLSLEVLEEVTQSASVSCFEGGFVFQGCVCG
jgi:hypothetical protein